MLTTTEKVRPTSNTKSSSTTTTNLNGSGLSGSKNSNSAKLGEGGKLSSTSSSSLSTCCGDGSGSKLLGGGGFPDNSGKTASILTPDKNSIGNLAKFDVENRLLFENKAEQTNKSFLPTAFVSPQTVQISVQPPTRPTSPPPPTPPPPVSLSTLLLGRCMQYYNNHNNSPMTTANSPFPTSSNSWASSDDKKVNKGQSSPAAYSANLNYSMQPSGAILGPDCEQQGRQLQRFGPVVARRQSMFESGQRNNRKVLDGMIEQQGPEEILTMAQDQSPRRSSMGGSTVAGISFRTDYSPTRDLHNNWQDAKTSSYNNYDNNFSFHPTYHRRLSSLDNNNNDNNSNNYYYSNNFVRTNNSNSYQNNTKNFNNAHLVNYSTNHIVEPTKSSNTNLISKTLSANNSLNNSNNNIVANNVSDERLEKLEQRMQLLESKFLSPNYSNHYSTKQDNNISQSTLSLTPNFTSKTLDNIGCNSSKSMRDLPGAISYSDSDSNLTNYQQGYCSDTSKENNMSSFSFQNLSSSTKIPSGNNCDKVHYMSQKIRDLQKILEEEQQQQQPAVSNNSSQWRQNIKLKSTTLHNLANVTDDNEECCKVIGPLYNSLDDLMREKKNLQDTVEDLKKKLEMAPEQYVTMQRYRLLKAKSKKLLQDKCEALRQAILEKESLQVRMQLQNKELSELRRKVYENNQAEAKDEKFDMLLRDELVRTCKSSAQTSACLLNVCKDVIVNKRCPDYDQILGLKPIEDPNLRRSLKSLNGSTNSLNNSVNLTADSNNNNNNFDAEQLLTLHKSTLQNLDQMQRLMVDYYTNELVDSIDCKVQ